MNRHLTAENAQDTENAKYLNELTEGIIAAAMEVHRAGHCSDRGCWNPTYEICLCRELAVGGIPFQRQVPIAVEYKGMQTDCGSPALRPLRPPR